MARGTSLVAQLRGLSAQPGLRRAMPAIALVLSAAAALGLYLMLAQPAQMTLAPNLPEAEKGRALDLLTAGGIAASLDPATGALRVATTDYHRARMMLASEGLPQALGAAGPSPLADMPLGASRSVESARLRQLHEHDLARSIMEIEAIHAARVHLALPERTAFIREQVPPRASVFVQLAPGRALDEAQVRAIVSLVSASVTGLTQGNVSVVDQSGRLLSMSGDDPVAFMTDQQTRHRMRMEGLYRNRIEALLTPIVGLGNAAVEVTLDMDFTRSEITREQYDPDSGVLRSERAESDENTRTEARGIPGAVANTPPAQPQLAPAETDEEGAASPPPAESNPNQGRRSSSFTRNYELNRQVETIRPSGAQLRKIHAAIVLSAPVGANGAETLSAETLADVERLIRTAIGFDAERGDTVTVTSHPFRDLFPDVAQPWHTQPWLQAVARQAAQIAIVAIVILGIMRPILSRVLPPAPGQALSSPALAGLGTGGAVEVAEGDSLAELRRRLSRPLDPDDFDGAFTYEEKVMLARRLAQNDTDRIASAFRTMISSEREMVR